ncbi:HET-domain-containing protein [Thozetella sp. PMI_491]|nr:HET-domain-containing protein [Thozetella sp. PMI_491]
MRLLNTATLRLETFLVSELPPYAILSHTWAQDEVLFEDLEPAKNPVLGKLTTNKAGGSKLVQSARLAAQEGYQYIWIDTCCIDKSSSAELSEAINSMFRWYMLSTVCYAYLADVDATPSDTAAVLDQFHRCRWFTRGWTLQELIAPGNLVFFNKSWNPIGTRDSLKSNIEQISQVPSPILASDASQKPGSRNPLHYLSRVSVSTRLSWAARRQTQRIEDEAYSLMGMFGINMPLIYGEGSNAFQRLQEELIRISDDQSILAFRNPRSNPMPYGERICPDVVDK